jgi:hypothetical protein
MWQASSALSARNNFDSSGIDHSPLSNSQQQSLLLRRITLIACLASSQKIARTPNHRYQIPAIGRNRRGAKSSWRNAFCVGGTTAAFCVSVPTHPYNQMKGGRRWTL